MTRSVDIRAWQFSDRKDYTISGRFDDLFAVGDWVMRYCPAAKKCKLDSVWVGPSLVVSIVDWAVGIQKFPDAPILLVHCQDVKKVPQPSGVRSWITTPSPVSAPPVPVLGTSTVAHTSPSIDVLPPDEGVVLADVDSAGVHSASGFKCLTGLG